MRAGAILLLVASLGTMSGCAAFRGYRPSLQEPAPPVRKSTGAPLPSASVDVISQTGVSGARSVSLVEVLRRAREDSFAVLAAAEEVEVASGRVQAATGQLLPGAGLDVGGSYLHGRDINNAGEILDGLSYARYEPSIRIYYTVNPGAALARAAGHRHEADSAALSALEASRSAALQASIAYLDLALAVASVEIARQLVEDSERFVEITQARAQAEVGSGSDLARAQADAARARQTLIRARGRWERASVRLAVLLRWPADEFLIPSEREIRPSALLDVEVAGDLHSEALRARPDLRASQARAQAAESQVSAARWDLFGPELDAGVRERVIGTELSDLGPTTLAHIFVRFSFSFEELGRLRSAQAQARGAQLREAALREQVLGEIETARSSLGEALAAIPEAQVSVDATERSYQSQVARFEAGTGLGIEVIEAQNARARARQDLAEAILRYNAAQMELAASLGYLTPSLLESAAKASAKDTSR